MSGFVAILNLDYSQCAEALLRELTNSLAFRGPDDLDWVTHGSIGLGATLLRTTEQSAHESQPFSFDGSAWIAGDVRLDDRAHLILQLRAAGRRALAGEPDINLVLHAWLAWGADCVTRLQGDFSFVIWDEQRAELFAARDHFGVRPLYYALNERVLCLSNTLATLRRHPLVPATLDESFIADFLLFGWSDTPAATAFRDIRRLDAAHRLSFSNGTLSVQRYWEVPTYREPLRFRDPREYVRQFREVMRHAVADRLRTKVVGIELSGGIDSTCVAATARDLQRRGATSAELYGWTFDSAGLFPDDDELFFSALAANRLGLTQRTFNMRDYVLFRERNGAVVSPAGEPSNLMLAAAWVDSVQEVASAGRVLLTGHPGDGILASSQEHVLRMLRRGRWLRAAYECGGYLLRHHKVPPLGIRSRLKQRLGLVPPVPAFPAWIEPELVRRLGLREKWQVVHQRKVVSGDDLRAEAARHMRTSWASILDAYDAEWSGSAVEYRHPLFDLRVIDFLLQVPPLPWLASKELVRDAWPDLLPEVVRNRPKVPLRGDHLRARVVRGDDAPLEWQCPDIGHFICSKSAPAFQSCVDAPVSLYLVAYTVSLGLWLRNIQKKDDHDYSQTHKQRTRPRGFTPQLQHSPSD